MTTESEEDNLPTIMVVDDDIDVKSLVHYVARNEGLFVSIKDGGLSALKFLHELNYDLDAIIIDLSMPDMDGITLTRHIRQNENLRSKQRQMKIYWFTNWPYDPTNPHDPIILGAVELHVSDIFRKVDCDVMEIVQRVKADLT